MRRRLLAGGAGALAVGLALFASLSDRSTSSGPLVAKLQAQRRALAISGGTPLLALLSPPGAGYDSTNVALSTASGTAVTISRASTQTCEVSPGVLASIASNKPCVESGALKVEPSGTNLLLQSSAFDDAAWTKSNATISANATTAPDGTSAADKLVEAATNSTHFVVQAYTAADSTIHTCSVYAKAAERSFVYVEAATKAGGFPAGYFNLSTCAAASNPGSGTQTVQSSGGWCRVGYSVNVGTGASATKCTFMAASADGIVSYAGSTSSGIYLWHGQAESGSVMTSPIPTGAATASRAPQTTTVPKPAGLSTTEGCSKVCFTPRGWSTTTPSGNQWLISPNAASSYRIGYLTTTFYSATDGTSFPGVASSVADGVRGCYRTSWSATRNTLRVENLTTGVSATSVFSGFASFAASVNIGSDGSGTNAALGRIDSLVLGSSPDGCR